MSAMQDHAKMVPPGVGIVKAQRKEAPSEPALTEEQLARREAALRLENDIRERREADKAARSIAKNKADKRGSDIDATYLECKKLIQDELQNAGINLRFVGSRQSVGDFCSPPSFWRRLANIFKEVITNSHLHFRIHPGLGVIRIECSGEKIKSPAIKAFRRLSSKFSEYEVALTVLLPTESQLYFRNHLTRKLELTRHPFIRELKDPISGKIRSESYEPTDRKTIPLPL